MQTPRRNILRRAGPTRLIDAFPTKMPGAIEAESRFSFSECFATLVRTIFHSAEYVHFTSAHSADLNGLARQKQAVNVFELLSFNTFLLGRFVGRACKNSALERFREGRR